MNSATIFNVCEEMQIEILRRLPVKSLVRFTSVCRRWKSIITGPQFRLESSTTKLLVHTGEECYALVEGDEDDENLVLSETVEFPFKHWLRNAKVVGSGNGLVCIDVRRKGRPVIMIWNPSTRRHAVIPANKDEVLDENIISQGFGATISGDDYKYVRIVSLGEKMAVDIYSWKTDTWRRIYLDVDLYEHKYFSSESAVSLRGRLHWAAFDERGKDIINYISVFDLEEEVFDQDIMLPECFSSGVYCLNRVNLFVTKESQLAMIENEDEPNRASVWVMQEYGDVNSLTKLFRLDLAVIVDQLNRVLQDEPCIKEDCIRRVPAVVHLLKNGEILLQLEARLESPFFPPKLVVYNPKTSMATEIRGISSSPRLCGFTNYYKESLAFLAAHDDRRVQADDEVLSGERPAVRRNYEAFSGSGPFKRRVKRHKQY